MKKNKNLDKKTIEYNYSNFWFDNGMWYGETLCPNCKEKNIKSSNGQSSLYKKIKKYEENGKCCSLCISEYFTIKNKGENNPFYGKKHSKKTKNKISKSRKGKAMGLENSMADEKNRKKVSVALKEVWSSERMDKQKKINSEKMTNYNLNSDGTNISKCEDIIYEILCKNNINVIRQYVVENRKFDFYFPEKNLLIEFNGTFWHCDPRNYNETYYNKKKEKTAKELWDYDKNKIDKAIKCGYLVDIIWEIDFRKNNELILELLKKY